MSTRARTHTPTHTPGYLTVCLAIEYVQTSPWLLSWLSLDPKTDENAENDDDEEDEDVAAEARRVERMEGLLAEGTGEVVLNNLRKVYRTRQASSQIWLLCEPFFLAVFSVSFRVLFYFHVRLLSRVHLPRQVCYQRCSLAMGSEQPWYHTSGSSRLTL